MAPSQHEIKIVYRDVKQESKQKQQQKNKQNQLLAKKTAVYFRENSVIYKLIVYMFLGQQKYSQNEYFYVIYSYIHKSNRNRVNSSLGSSGNPWTCSYI